MGCVLEGQGFGRLRGGHLQERRVSVGLAPFLVRVEPQCPCLEIAIVFHKVQLLRNDLLSHELQQKGKKCLYQHK